MASYTPEANALFARGALLGWGIGLLMIIAVVVWSLGGRCSNPHVSAFCLYFPICWAGVQEAMMGAEKLNEAARLLGLDLRVSEKGMLSSDFADIVGAILLELAKNKNSPPIFGS